MGVPMGVPYVNGALAIGELPIEISICQVQIYGFRLRLNDDAHALAIGTNPFGIRRRDPVQCTCT
jgi:hypothetical protein